MTDEQERIEWHTMRDTMLARCMRENPGYTREECLEAMALTFWRVIADRIEPVCKEDQCTRCGMAPDPRCGCIK